MTRLPVTTAAGLLIAAAFAGAQAPASQPRRPQHRARASHRARGDIQSRSQLRRGRCSRGRPRRKPRGLKQEDFQVLEDGKPQKIQTFGMVDIPLTRPRKPLFLEGTHYRSSRMLPSTSRCSTGGYT